MSSESSPVTVFLERIRAGTDGARNALVAFLYDRFRERAHMQLRRERPGHSLATTDLTHEAWLRLDKNNEIAKAADGNQLFRAFARAMRQVLIDHARHVKADKRGGGRQREELDDLLDVVHQRSRSDVLSLDESLKALAAEHSRMAEVLEMRFFGGYAMREIAEEWGVSLATVERDARFGLAWLRACLASENNP